MYYLCSKNIGADQLHGYRVANMPLFSHMQKAGFSHDVAHINVTCIYPQV